MSQCAFLISKVSIAQPVIDTATDTVWIGTISVTVAVVDIAIAAATGSSIAISATAKEPIEWIQNRDVDTGAGRRSHRTQKSDRQQQSSDAKSHTEFLGETGTI
jgi:hypothetical protein